MNKITNISLKYLNRTSNYLKPARIEYTINGRTKSLDLIKTHDSVSALLFNKSRKVLVLVKQFRPLVYIGSLPRNERLGNVDLEKYPVSNGMTIEACSGIIDKRLSIKQVGVEEISEECGYSVKPEHLEKIITCRTGPVLTSAMNHCYYCEVDDSMKSNGQRVEEGIEVIEMSVEEVREYLKSKHFLTTPILLHGFYWFLNNKAKKFQ